MSNDLQYASVFRPGLFAGRTILVTGGGSGLGRCTAHELKSLGARLAIAGRTQEKLDRVKEELGDPDTFTFAADLRREEEVKAMVDGVLAWSGGRIDGLVNNAGGQFPAQLKDISLNGWNAVVNNNMTATFLVSKAVYLGSMEKHGGAIVNVGADFELGNPGMGHNGAARAGQTNFTYTASVEWAHSGVRVNSVLPGFIASSGFDRYPERAPRCAARCEDPGAAETARHRVGDRGCHRLPAERCRGLCHRHVAARGRRPAQCRQVELLRSAGSRPVQAVQRLSALPATEDAGVVSFHLTWP